MTTIVKSAAYAASNALALAGSKVKRSHITEVLAALLGYNTYASLATEEEDSSIEYHLEDAEILVLNQTMAMQRALALGILVPSALEVCVSALKSFGTANSIAVYVGVAEFYDSFAREELASAIGGSEYVSSAMAETNAEFHDDPDMPELAPTTEDLWAARNTWSISSEAKMNGTHDVERDRMFAGDTLNCHGELFFEKAGRAGLIYTDSRSGASVDDSWRMDGIYDEYEEMELDIQ